MSINIERRRILMQGYATQKDVRLFLKIGYVKAKKVIEEITASIESQNKKVLPGAIPSRFLLDYVNITEKKIFEYAEIEQKKITGGNQ